MAYYELVLRLYGFIVENVIVCKRRLPNAKLQEEMELKSSRDL